jgi:ABC-type multidrug transport system ATPase subunit
MTDAVVVERLVKRFDATTALAGISCAIRAGELFGFIGPDGAGKTTLFRILTTLLVPDEGHARVLGRNVVADIRDLRRRTGYMPGRFSLYPDLSVEENVTFYASVFGTTLAAEYDHIAPIYRQLEPFRTRRAGALSGGMKQKLALCCALVHRPEILFLDEPTTGVDAVSRRELWDLLARFKAAGITIVVSTPYMDEASRCDRVALMLDGRLLIVDTPAGVAASFDRPLLAVRTDDRYGAIARLRRFEHAATVYPFGEALHYTDARTGVAADRLAADVRRFLSGEGLTNVDVSIIPATIEDRFMALAASGDAS